MNNKEQLVKAQENNRNKLNSLPIGQFMNMSSIKNRILSMLGSDRGLRFITGVTSAVTTNSKLAECTNDSIYNGALLGETLNLSPSPQLGQYYLVPFKNNKTGITVAQFQLGYKGYIQLAIRSGQYKKINVIEVKEGEFVEYDMFNEELIFNPIKNYNQRKMTKTIGYYAMFEYLNGFRKTLYMSKEEMLDHADTYSSAFNKIAYEELLQGKIPEKEMWRYSSFWYKNFDEMAKKTMLRQLISKWGIMSVEMQKAYEADMGEIKDNGQVEYIDNSNDDKNSVIEAEFAPKDEMVSNNEEETVEDVKQVDLNEI